MVFLLSVVPLRAPARLVAQVTETDTVSSTSSSTQPRTHLGYKPNPFLTLVFPKHEKTRFEIAFVLPLTDGSCEKRQQEGVEWRLPIVGLARCRFDQSGPSARWKRMHV